MKKYLLLLTASLSLTVAQGQTTFQKTYGGTTDDRANYALQTSDSGYIITGSTKSFGAGSYDVYVIKTDKNGDILWSRSFGGSGSDYSKTIQQTSDGGYIIEGVMQGAYIYLIKTDMNGNINWTKAIDGMSDGNGHSVQQTKDGGYIITGWNENIGVGYFDTYLIKTDITGTAQWAKTYGLAYNDLAYSVQQTTEGGYILIGSTSKTPGAYSDIYFIKTDSNGDTLWTKTYGGSKEEEGFTGKQTNDGGYILFGSTLSFGAGNSDAYLVKIDSAGNTQWEKTYGGSDWEIGSSVWQTKDGGFILTGSTKSFGFGYNRVYIIKTNVNGNIAWSKIFGDSNSDDVGSSVCQTYDGGYIIGGMTHSGIGSNDFFLIKTDSLGNSGCNESTFNPIETSPTSTTSMPATQVSSGILIGNFTTQTGGGGIATTICSTAGINYPQNKETGINVFPNPFSSQTTLQSDIFLKNASLSVYNSVGQTVKHVDNLAGQTVILHRDNLPSGLYFVRLTQDGSTISAVKFVIIDK